MSISVAILSNSVPRQSSYTNRQSWNTIRQFSYIRVARLSINIATLSISFPILYISVERLSTSVATWSIDVPRLSVSEARLSINVATLSISFLILSVRVATLSICFHRRTIS